jgi:hypothetical protein
LSSGRSAKITSAIASVVPTGDVDSITKRSPGFSTGITERVALSTYDTSGS